ncbi:MAG TPA: YetF domain-containing protein [Thermoanaerobaculia bacterium]
MWNLAVPWWELIVRGAAVYVFMLILLRLTGKRQVGQLAPFDLVLLLVLSNAVQNSMNAGDNSLVGGLISATTLVLLNYLVGAATFRSKRLEEIIEGRPQVLIHNGKLYDEVMASAQLTHHELSAALRQAGCSCVEEVHSAVLENNGSISVLTRKTAADAAAG